MAPLWLLDCLFNFSENGSIAKSCLVCKKRDRQTPQSNKRHHERLPRSRTRQGLMNGNISKERIQEIAAKQDSEENAAKSAVVDGGQNVDKDADEEKAAALIQRNYRGYRERRQLKGIGLSASTRWQEAIRELQYRKAIRPLSRDERSSMSTDRARQNWKRIGAIATRAGHDDTSDEENEEEMTNAEREENHRKKHEAKIEREKTAKMMDLQYFLEMVDSHHRYGSNLRSYHAEWMKSDTHENFFYWLDHGEGRDINLPLVPRERLDSERVRYLSREERQNYLVTVDDEGRLCWAHNGERITTSLEYKDSVDGIVQRDDKEHKPWAGKLRSASFSSDSSSSILSARSNHNTDAYQNHELKRAKGLHKLKHVSASTILNQLLQMSVRPNSWIFVADTSFRLYLGIKQSGAFQHSSFLHGGRISAAGLMRVKDGQLRRLSPLSGHYRPPTKNFRQFVHSMRDEGVDMSRVSISRSYAVLAGLEAYVRTRKKIKHVFDHVTHEKDKLIHPEEVKKNEEEEKNASESAEKERKVIEAEFKKREEVKKRESVGSRLMRKLHLRSPSSPEKASKDNATQSPETPLSASGEDVESGIPPEGRR